MEYLGRRSILLYGAAGMAVCELIVAAIGSANIGEAGGKAQIA